MRRSLRAAPEKAKRQGQIIAIVEVAGVARDRRFKTSQRRLMIPEASMDVADRIVSERIVRPRRKRRRRRHARVAVAAHEDEQACLLREIFRARCDRDGGLQLRNPSGDLALHRIGETKQEARLRAIGDAVRELTRPRRIARADRLPRGLAATIDHTVMLARTCIGASLYKSIPTRNGMLRSPAS